MKKLADMTITDLINNDTIIPVTQEERRLLAAEWQTYEILKWGELYITPVDPKGKGPLLEGGYVFVTAYLLDDFLYISTMVSINVIKNDPAFATYIVSLQMKKALNKHLCSGME